MENTLGERVPLLLAHDITETLIRFMLVIN